MYENAFSHVWDSYFSYQPDSENDKEDISSEDTDESSSSSSDNEEAEKITDTLENETTNSLTDQKLAPPILAPSATSLSNVASINANAAEKSPSPPPSTAAPENQNDAAAVVVDEQNQDEIEKSANADAADKLIVPPLKLTVNSRREELLKQLRAVEEAIAKKRSMKMTTM
uniref:Uncharacterized protein n=1 Tax=Romanomermis culicivorax TaxID=13658 RepID=A0A915J1S0_ROMCU